MIRATMESGRPTVYSFAGESPIDLGALRSRLEAMDSAALMRFGQAAAFMCSPRANMGKEPREAFVVQLQEAREEWRRRQTASPQARP
jgi:hypothetical protein